MSIEAELSNLTLADVLNAGGVTELYAIPPGECPLLDELNREALNEQERRILGLEIGRYGLLTAAVAVRALFLTARQKPLPETERFLREVSHEDFDEAACGLKLPSPPGVCDINFGKEDQISPPIVWEANRNIPESRGAPDDRLDAVTRGLALVCPVLRYAAALRANRVEEDNL